MQAIQKIAAVVLLAFVACAGEDDAETRVAVRNSGNASIDATISDGETDLAFANVAAGTTSTFQTASFGSLSALTVTVGTQESTVDLDSGKRNVVAVGADGRVTGVVASAPSSDGDGW